MTGLRNSARTLVALALTAWAAAAPSIAATDESAWLESLSRSTDADHLLAAALLTPRDAASGRSAEAFYAGALSAAPDDPVVLSATAIDCLRRRDGSYCGPDLFRHLTELDADNGAAWQIAAAEQARAGNDEAALALIGQATSAPVYDNYFRSHVGVFDRTLRAFGSRDPASDGTPKTHLNEVLDLAAAVVSTTISLPPACRGMQEQRRDPTDPWTDRCLALGEAMEKKGMTAVTVGIGLGIQEDALWRYPERRRELTAARQRAKNFFEGDYQESVQRLEALPPEDLYFYRFLDNLIRLGDLKAHELVRSDLAARDGNASDAAAPSPGLTGATSPRAATDSGPGAAGALTTESGMDSALAENELFTGLNGRMWLAITALIAVVWLLRRRRNSRQS